LDELANRSQLDKCSCCGRDVLHRLLAWSDRALPLAYDRSSIAKRPRDDPSCNAKVMTAIGGEDMNNTIALAHVDFHGKLFPTHCRS